MSDDNQQQWELALARVSQAIVLNPNSALAYNNSGFCLLQPTKMGFSASRLQSSHRTQSQL